MAKPDTRKVQPVWARLAMSNVMSAGKSINTIYSEYIMICYHSTGRLASGCDAKDLVQWIKENMPDEYAAVIVRKGEK